MLDRDQQYKSNSFACGFSTLTKKGSAVKAAKPPVSFERRFLSVRGSGNDCALEIAMVWHGSAMSIRRYDPKPGLEISVGSDEHCQYSINLSDDQNNVIIAKCDASNKWHLVSCEDFSGILICGDEVVNLNEAALETPVDGDVRAKYVFGEVQILVRYVEKNYVSVSYRPTVDWSRYSSVLVSIFLHVVLLFGIFMSSDRVEALIIDKTMTAARFSPAVSFPDMSEDSGGFTSGGMDEGMPETIESPNDLKMGGYAQNTVDPIGGNPVKAVAKSHPRATDIGLLAQTQAMNSLLAAAEHNSWETLEWKSFDSDVSGDPSQKDMLNATGTDLSGIDTINSRFGGLMSNHGGTSLQNLGNGLSLGLGNTKMVYITGNDKDVSVRMVAGVTSFCTGPVQRCLRDEKSSKVVGSKPASKAGGGLNKRIIQKIVRSHEKEIRHCYEKSLRNDKMIEGKIETSWIIMPSGNVSHVKVVSSTVDHKNMEQCVVNTIKYWRFPAYNSSDPMIINYPFGFNVKK